MAANATAARACERRRRCRRRLRRRQSRCNARPRALGCAAVLLGAAALNLSVGHANDGPSTSMSRGPVSGLLAAPWGTWLSNRLSRMLDDARLVKVVDPGQAWAQHNTLAIELERLADHLTNAIFDSEEARRLVSKILKAARIARRMNARGLRSKRDVQANDRELAPAGDALEAARAVLQPIVIALERARLSSYELVPPSNRFVVPQAAFDEAPQLAERVERQMVAASQEFFAIVARIRAASVHRTLAPVSGVATGVQTTFGSASDILPNQHTGLVPVFVETLTAIEVSSSQQPPAMALSVRTIAAKMPSRARSATGKLGGLPEQAELVRLRAMLADASPSYARLYHAEQRYNRRIGRLRKVAAGRAERRLGRPPSQPTVY